MQRLELEDPHTHLADLPVAWPPQGQPAAERVPHSAPDIEVGGRPGDGLAGPPRLGHLGLLQRPLDEVRQLEILEEDLQELVARQHEGEAVLSLAIRHALPSPAPAGAFPRLLDVVARTEGLVAGQHVLATTAMGRVVEGRFADAVGRHGDIAAAIDLGDAPLAH